jgi:hypothetical protein
MKLASNRLAQLLGAFVEEQIRQAGVNFTQNTPRRLKALAKELNEKYKLDPPLQDKEMAEIYLIGLGRVVSSFAENLGKTFEIDVENLGDKIEVDMPQAG